jgi:AraC-like DNA-binding protein
MKAVKFTICRAEVRHAIEIHEGREVSQYDTDWHFHKEWQFVLVTEGRRSFEWCRGGCVIERGQILALPPDFIHRGRSSNEPASFLMLYVPAILLRSAPLISGAARTMRDRVESRRFLEELSKCVYGDADYTLECLLNILSHAVPYPNVKITQSILLVKNWLAANQGRPHFFDDLGAVSGYSPYHLTHLFREEAGVPPRTYKTLLRLAEARQRIASGQSLSAVAAASGFADQSHLGRRFRRAFGLTPANYRRLCN